MDFTTLRSVGENSEKIVKAFHGLKKIVPDPEFEIGMAAHISKEYSYEDTIELYGRFVTGESDFDMRMRRIIWRALSQRFGNSVNINPDVRFKHIETFEIGDGVFIGTQTYIQGRLDGKCVIGNHVWIGPQSFFDARDLIIEDYVGWGPGAKVLGSMHTGNPISDPIIQTDIEIKPVRICEWADIGTNAVILPGVNIGKGSIVGAGAVVTKDVQPFAIVAGIPAQFLNWREGYIKSDTDRD